MSSSREEIAVIGMAGRFPGSRNIHEFWQNLRKGVVSIEPFTEDRLKASGVDEATLGNPSFVNAGAVMEDADCFDAEFFGYTPLEAEIVDPQQRVFLECAWEALEDAGYNPETYDGLIGVFGGVSTNTYFQRILMSRPDIVEKAGPTLVALSNEKDHTATRVSFKLNTRGPSISVQTACSASGVAIHLACQSVLSGECDMALAGGVRVDAPLHCGYLFEEGGILSPDGRCRVFDAESRGTVFGSGVGMIVVKRLSDAIRDGDTVYALIKGTAVNNDGSLKAGYSAPSIQGQAAVIEEALMLAEVSADTIGYIEAHGTGTCLGDPIEIAALTKAFRNWTDRKGYCAVGSVKANVGHLFAGAGVAGVIKAILALKEKRIPPTPNFKSSNPQIDFQNSPFYVNDRLSEWRSGDAPRRAGVSSFGMGGTNAHIVLEEAPEAEPSGSGRSHQLIVFSARSEAALERATGNLVGHLTDHPGLDLADVAYSLQMGRKAFEHRRMIVGENLADVADGLARMDPERVLSRWERSKNVQAVFMFSGQGSQYVDMGLELYGTEPEFRKEIDRCSEALVPLLGMDLREVMYPAGERADEAALRLRSTEVTQPALFTVEYALARLWMSWGVRPAALVGHSIGEYVSACLAGVVSLADALRLVVNRGRLMQACERGVMLAARLSEEEMKPYLGGGISLAAVNAPTFCVVSGRKEAVRELEETLAAKKVGCRNLHTSHAFHSDMMDPIVEEFGEVAGQVAFHPPQIPIVSTVTGTWVRPEEIMAPGYWVRNLRQTVRFADCVKELLKEPDGAFLEVGPGNALSTFVRQHPDRPKTQTVVSSLRHPQEKKSDVDFILNTLGRLWLSGIEVDWAGFHREERRRRVPLPTYPFERVRRWIEPSRSLKEGFVPRKESRKRPDLAEWFYLPSWKRTSGPEGTARRRLDEKKEAWLLFLDGLGFGLKLAEFLEAAGQEVIRVRMGERFEEADGNFTINPERRDEYDALIGELRQKGMHPDKVVHLWSFTEEASPLSGMEAFRRFQETGFYSLLFLAQALSRQRVTEAVEMIVVSNLLHDVLDEARSLCPEKSTLLAACKVIPQEVPNVRCRSIDFGHSGVEKTQVEQLCSEMGRADSDSVVAYRGKHRWSQIYEEVRLEEVVGRPACLREKGVYLILGGLGRVGLAMAECLAEAVHARLILVSRSGLPAEDQRDPWLASHGAADSTSRRIRRVRGLERLGAEVSVMGGDVTDEGEMRRVIDRAEERFGAIHGVIHAAGAFSREMIEDISPSLFEERHRAKIEGLFVLEKVLRGKPLDFCLLTSSLSSVLGGYGYAGYAAANLFMDGFACLQEEVNPVPWVSVNWDAWPFDEAEREERDYSGELKELAMDPEEAREALLRILSVAPRDRIVVSSGDLQGRSDKWIKLEPQERDRRKGRDAEPSGAERPELAQEYVAPGDETEEAIAGIWRELLGIETIGIHDNFFDLGGHSLLVAGLTARLRSAFPRIEFRAGSVFERPTVRLLSQMVDAGREEESTLVKSQSRGKRRKERRLRRTNG